MAVFSKTSRQHLDTCHPDLQLLMEEVIKRTDVTILCGHRDEAAQTDAYIHHVSKLQWPKSRHNSYPSEAVDIAPYPIEWSNIERFKQLATIVKECAARLAIDVEWGGDWNTFLDYPHWQLKKK